MNILKYKIIPLSFALFLLSSCIFPTDPFEEAYKKGVTNEFNDLNKSLPDLLNVVALQSKIDPDKVDDQFFEKFNAQLFEHLVTGLKEVLININTIIDKLNEDAICLAVKSDADTSQISLKFKRLGYFGTSLGSQYKGLTCKRIRDYLKANIENLAKYENKINEHNSKKWIIPLKGADKDISEANALIKKAYEYDAVKDAPFCVLSFASGKTGKVRDLLCFDTYTNGVGKDNCVMFTINMFNNYEKTMSSPESFIDYAACSSKSLENQGGFINFLMLMQNCAEDAHSVMKAHGCYLIKDKFHLWKDSYKINLGYK